MELLAVELLAIELAVELLAIELAMEQWLLH